MNRSEPARATQVPTDRFSLVLGGPFHSLLTRLGGMEADGLPKQRTAFVLAALAWSLPAVLVVAQSLVVPGHSGWSFFSDATAYARFLVAIVVMVATERYADGRFRLLIEQFRSTRIVSEAQTPEFLRAMALADRRSSSTLAEGLILVLAYAMAGWGVRTAAHVATTGWERSLVGGEVGLSWAGTAASLVGGPLFFFLMFRWCWRFTVWTILLFHLSRLRLALTPTHPDRCGGLGFLSLYPSVFTGFVFALSSVVAVTVLRELEYVDLSTDQIRWMLGGWLALILALFIGPLVVFVPVLRAAREQALLEYGRLAHQHHDAFHERWVESLRSGRELLGSSDPSSSSDLNSIVLLAHEMQVFPIDRFAIVQLLGAAGIPLMAVVLTRVPLVELARRIGLGFL